MLKLCSGVSLAETEYGVALLDEESGQYYNLNPTGALVLRKLLDGGTPEQAVQALVEEYDVGEDDAGRDVKDLVDQLRQAELVEG
jgi:Coenzyme PQQ synthesis protein D (PqqD)